MQRLLATPFTCQLTLFSVEFTMLFVGVLLLYISPVYDIVVYTGYIYEGGNTTVNKFEDSQTRHETVVIAIHSFHHLRGRAAAD